MELEHRRRMYVHPSVLVAARKLTDRLIGFISKSWRITSHGMFAGSCIGVILLVMSLEFFRRLSKEYDRYILQRFKEGITGGVGVGGGGGGDLVPQKSNPKLATTTTAPDSATDGNNNANHCSAETTISASSTIHFRPSPIQQSIRALLHMVTFAIAYFVMLLAMYYNGYFIICIFIGAYLGAFVFTWERIGVSIGYAFFSSFVVCVMYWIG